MVFSCRNSVDLLHKEPGNGLAKMLRNVNCVRLCMIFKFASRVISINNSVFIRLKYNFKIWGIYYNWAQVISKSCLILRTKYLAWKPFLITLPFSVCHLRLYRPKQIITMILLEARPSSPWVSLPFLFQTLKSERRIKEVIKNKHLKFQCQGNEILYIKTSCRGTVALSILHLLRGFFRQFLYGKLRNE